ncbi:hypothetical protein TYRP_009818 [Tyrophagus putrescentiae]|nr:hypothetical protein TYRP_009818 [Tyrophagus putrescentiae]
MTTIATQHLQVLLQCKAGPRPGAKVACICSSASGSSALASALEMYSGSFHFAELDFGTFHLCSSSSLLVN